MHKNVTIYNELKELNSWLADISNINVFTVPDGYFSSLSSDMLHIVKDQNTINELDIPVLDMKVPDGYFDGLADVIMGKIKLEEAGNLSEPAFLPALTRKNVFSVPEGYFEGLAENILMKLPQQPAKLVAMKPRASFFKYALAAAITGVLGFSLFSVFNKKTGTETMSQQTSTVIDIAKGILKNNSFDKEMDALADDDIINYLKNDGEDINTALVASLTDEKTLPNEDAYFTDEKALDNFLNEQHIVQAGNN